MGVKIHTAGRKDTRDLFRLHIGREAKLVHSPLLVFTPVGETIMVDQVFKGADLLPYPDETKVMVIWPGKWRSDFFQFTVGEYRDFYTGETTNG